MEVTLKVTADIPDDILQELDPYGIEELQKMSEAPETKSIRLTKEDGTMLFIYDREERG